MVKNIKKITKFLTHSSKKKKEKCKGGTKKCRNLIKKEKLLNTFYIFLTKGGVIEYDDFWFIAVVVGKSSMYSALYYPIIFLFGKV